MKSLHVWLCVALAICGATAAPASEPRFKNGNITMPGTITGTAITGTTGTFSSTVKTATEFNLFSVAPNALLTAIALGGTVTAAQPITVTGVTLYVATQALATAANTVFTITDGTNTCTATFTCDGTGIASFQGTGSKRVTTANGAGTGCVYAASAALVISVTTQGCATAAVVNNVNVLGKPQ